MEPWQESLLRSVTSAEQLAQQFDIDAAAVAGVAERYPLRITPHILGLIDVPDDPLGRQFIPDPRELESGGLPDDPLAEEAHSPLPALVHRYPDRALLLAAGSCAGYCRFCTRKRRVGCPNGKVSFGEIEQALSYIEQHPEIRDVLISGGDPLLMTDLLLKQLLDRLQRIEHVELIRIGSRVPVVLPERITENLCRLLSGYRPLYLNTHFNHPRELSPESFAACTRLADAGVVLGNQTVLLREINDDADTLLELCRGLLCMRVRPYYLHQLDLTAGAGHFRTPLATGLAIMNTLRGAITGLAIPQYVVDLPGGKGKVPLLPDTLQTTTDGWLIRTPQGELVRYSDPPDTA